MVPSAMCKSLRAKPAQQTPNRSRICFCYVQTRLRHAFCSRLFASLVGCISVSLWLAGAPRWIKGILQCSLWEDAGGEAFVRQAAPEDGDDKEIKLRLLGDWASMSSPRWVSCEARGPLPEAGRAKASLGSAGGSGWKLELGGRIAEIAQQA